MALNKKVVVNKRRKVLTRETALVKPQGILRALLPGAEVDRTGKIKVNFRTGHETIIINVGGVKFETYKSTILSQPEMPLGDENFLRSHFREDKGDYFFDRDPDMFRPILNFLRTGELHIPSHVCGPAAKIELEYWGISDDVIERCCWTDYNSWNAALNALNQLEKDRKGSLLDSEDSTPDHQLTSMKWRRRVWSVINHPTSSKPAKVYGWIALMLVILSIFTFMAETHPSFSYDEAMDKADHPDSGNISKDAIHHMDNRTLIPLNVTSSDNRIKLSTVHPVLEAIDYVCLTFFTLEYIVRIILAIDKFHFITSLTGIIDLLAILPDYIALIIFLAKPELHSEGSVDFIAILRIARVLRIFRLVRHVPGLWILVYTLKASFNELLLMAAFLLVGMLVFSSLIYFVEDHNTFTSIPHGFWWAIITMTTVGYGDMYPSTNLGYLIGSFTALSGLLMIGFSVPVLVNNFIMFYKHVQYALVEDAMKKKRKQIEKARRKRSIFEIIGKSSNCENNNDTPSENIPLQNASS